MQRWAMCGLSGLVIGRSGGLAVIPSRCPMLPYVGSPVFRPLHIRGLYAAAARWRCEGEGSQRAGALRSPGRKTVLDRQTRIVTGQNIRRADSEGVGGEQAGKVTSCPAL